MSDSPSSSSLDCLSIDDLAQRCRQESRKFLTSGTCNETYGLELFHRAICDRDEAAWIAIYAQYQPLVTRWVQNHSKFPSANEEAAFFVNAAFTRFWHAVSGKDLRSQFDDLSRLLAYLKTCAHSAIEDEWRRQQRWPRDALDDCMETLTSDAPSPEEWTTGKVAGETLEWAVLSRLKNEEELVVASLSWIYDLPPREIQARRPDLFPKVHRVYVVKRVILSRLLRDPRIRYLRRHMR